MKKACKNILPFIPLLADDALPEEKVQKVSNHLSACPACRRELDLYCAMKSAAGDLSAPALSSDFHEKLMERIKKETALRPAPAPRPTLQRYTWRRYAMGLSAAAALVVLSVVSFLGLSKQPLGTNPDDYVMKATDTAENSGRGTATPQTPPPQVTQSQVTQSQVTQSQVTQSQVTQSQVTQPQVTQPQVTQSQDILTDPTGPKTPQQTTPSQASSAPALLHTEPEDTVPKTYATYRVYVDGAHIEEAKAILSSLPKDAFGYRAEKGVKEALNTLSSLPGYHVGCEENDTLSSDYICLIAE